MNARPVQASRDANMSGHPTKRGVEEVWYRAPRLTLPIPGVREFQSRCEAAVPDLPLAAVEDLVSRKVPWSEWSS